MAQSDELMCNGCSQCEKVCPYGAITYVEKEVRGPGVREVRRVAAGQPGRVPGLRRLHRCLPLRRDGPEGLLQQARFMAEVDAICR